ncbi:MAG: hypothetical protein QXT16_04455 [Candidatus Caldarchaeum sp.]
MPRYGLRKYPVPFVSGDDDESMAWVATAIADEREMNNHQNISTVLLEMCRECVSRICEAEASHRLDRKQQDYLTLLHFEALSPLVSHYLLDEGTAGRMLDWFLFYSGIYDFHLITAFSRIPLNPGETSPVLQVISTGSRKIAFDSPVPRDRALFWSSVRVPIGLSGLIGDEEKVFLEIWMAVRHYCWGNIRNALNQQIGAVALDATYDEIIQKVLLLLSQTENPDELLISGSPVKLRPMYLDNYACIVAFEHASEQGTETVYAMLDARLRRLFLTRKPGEPAYYISVDRYIGPRELWEIIKSIPDDEQMG